MRANRPFPLEKTRKHASLGVHAPDPLRNGGHPHSAMGEVKDAFADGGLINGAVNTVPPNTAVVPSSEATGGFAKGGRIRKAAKKIT